MAKLFILKILIDKLISDAYLELDVTNVARGAPSCVLLIPVCCMSWMNVPEADALRIMIGCHHSWADEPMGLAY